MLDLERRHKELVKAVHPDRYQSTGDRRSALGKAVEVNEAFRKLRDPVTRAEACFAHYGVATGERNEPPAPPALLMQIMEQREELAEARAARDLPRAERVGAAARAREALVLDKLGSGFDAARDERDAATRRDAVTALLPELAELRYLRRLQSEVAAMLDE
jgi:molecular chaperone HscB